MDRRGPTVPKFPLGSSVGWLGQFTHGQRLEFLISPFGQQRQAAVPILPQQTKVLAQRRVGICIGGVGGEFFFSRCAGLALLLPLTGAFLSRLGTQRQGGILGGLAEHGRRSRQALGTGVIFGNR